MRWVATMAVLAATVSVWTVVACAQSGRGDNVLTAQQVLQRMEAQEVVVLDVRTPREYAAGHVEGAINVPYDQVGARVDEVRRLAGGRAIVLYCRSGRRSRLAEAELLARGVTDLWHLDGQYGGWARAGLPIETGR